MGQILASVARASRPMSPIEAICGGLVMLAATVAGLYLHYLRRSARERLTVRAAVVFTLIIVIFAGSVLWGVTQILSSGDPFTAR